MVDAIDINEEEDEEDDLEIRGLTTSQSSRYVSELKTAEKHFDKFLTQINRFNPEKYPKKYSPEVFSNTDLVSDLLDRFGTYLIEVAKVGKCSTTMQYLSKIKTKICRDHKGINIMGNGKWYGDIRIKVKQRYLTVCCANGTNLVDHAPPMKESDLKIMGGLLFERNTRQADLDRGILILQKQTIGRVSETSRLRYPNVRICKSESRYSKECCFVITITRLKTGQQHPINVFLHAYSWMLCPAHALATIIATAANPSDQIFPNILEGAESQYVNRLLQDLYDTWFAQQEGHQNGYQSLTKALSSHSGRAGGAQDASDHRDIQVQWIIPRGL